MTQNLERFVLEALQKKVINVVTGTFPIKYVGRNIETPVDGKWWELVYIPSNVENEVWADGKTYRGILRLILHWPQNNEGVYQALDEVKRVSDGFVKGERMSDPLNTVSVVVTEHPNMTDIIEQSPELLIPLTVRYSCFTI